ncbi:MAG: hypothetical protein IPK63_14255 [Candidatus Competibacteraceae bacterium]|nr:hypothetical protein [Candidatus Competibacteraceae bacterium]
MGRKSGGWEAGFWGAASPGGMGARRGRRGATRGAFGGLSDQPPFSLSARLQHNALSGQGRLYGRRSPAGRARTRLSAPPWLRGFSVRSRAVSSAFPLAPYGSAPARPRLAALGGCVQPLKGGGALFGRDGAATLPCRS